MCRRAGNVLGARFPTDRPARYGSQGHRRWAMASRAHVNLDFRFNSQPLTVSITERNIIGGRAWPYVYGRPFRLRFRLVVQFRLGAVGLLVARRISVQQPGRGITTVRGVEALCVLKFRALNVAQFGAAQAVFDELRGLDLKPPILRTQTTTAL